MELIFLITWVIFALVIGSFASSKGRDSGRWFVISILLSPIIAGLLVLISKDISEQEALRDGLLKKCLYCAEPVKKEATKCKHCGADLHSVA
jgi:uncharacterized membrane protein YhdT